MQLFHLLLLLLLLFIFVLHLLLLMRTFTAHPRDVSRTKISHMYIQARMHSSAYKNYMISFTNATAMVPENSCPLSANQPAVYHSTVGCHILADKRKGSFNTLISYDKVN